MAHDKSRSLEKEIRNEYRGAELYGPKSIESDLISPNIEAYAPKTIVSDLISPNIEAYDTIGNFVVPPKLTLKEELEIMSKQYEMKK